jgi:hypothetical protein
MLLGRALADGVSLEGCGESLSINWLRVLQLA